FRIGGIVLLSLDVGLHVGRWHQANGVAECLKLPRPMMGGGARFDPDQTRRKLLEEREHVTTLKLTAKHNLPIRIDAMNLKHRLRDIEADGGNRLHLAPP